MHLAVCHCSANVQCALRMCATCPYQNTERIVSRLSAREALKRPLLKLKHGKLGASIGLFYMLIVNKWFRTLSRSGNQCRGWWQMSRASVQGWTVFNEHYCSLLLWFKHSQIDPLLLPFLITERNWGLSGWSNRLPNRFKFWLWCSTRWRQKWLDCLSRPC